MYFFSFFSYYSSSKNGLSFGDPRFSSFKTNALPSTFASLVAPLNSGSSSPPSVLNSSCHLGITPSNTKDTNDTGDLKHILNPSDPQSSLFSSFGLGSFNVGTIPSVNMPLFSPLGDMNSTQALLNMVRTANSGSVNQLENYMKGTSTTTTNKRSAEMTVNNPLDLSSNAPLCIKKPKRPSSSGESFGSDNAVPISQKAAKDRAAQKSPGTVSPKLYPKSVFSVPSTQPQDRAATTCLSVCTSSLDRACSSREGIENVSHWSIDDVCNFVSSIDVCAEYAEVSRQITFDYSPTDDGFLPLINSYAGLINGRTNCDYLALSLHRQIVYTRYHADNTYMYTYVCLLTITILFVYWKRGLQASFGGTLFLFFKKATRVPGGAETGCT